jgi:hypothetical protein
MDFHGKWSEPTVAPVERETRKLASNLEHFANLLVGAQLDEGVLSTGNETTRAIWGVMRPDAVVELLRRYEWAADLNPVQLQLEFLAGNGVVLAEVDDWLLIAPQLRRSLGPGWEWKAAGKTFAVKRRSRVGERIGAYSEPEHRAVAEHVTGLKPAAVPNDSLAGLERSRRGVLLFYPIWTEDRLPEPFSPVAGFALLFPGRSQGTRIVWQVHNPSEPDAVVVSAD